MLLRRHRQDRGFTLLEVMLVIALLALLVKMVVINVGDFIPEWKLTAEAKKLATRISFLASEARLQGKQFCLEFDLDRHRVRTKMPPDYSKALLSDETPEMLDSNWIRLETPLRFSHIQVGTGDREVRKGKVLLPFEARGTSVDTVIVIGFLEQENLVTTLKVRGITGRVEILEGEHELTKVVERDFD